MSWIQLTDNDWVEVTETKAQDLKVGDKYLAGKNVNIVVGVGLSSIHAEDYLELILDSQLLGHILFNAPRDWVCKKIVDTADVSSKTQEIDLPIKDKWHGDHVPVMA